MTEPRALHLFFDYVDPASFLLEHRLRARPDFGSLQLHLHPFELHPPPNVLLDPEMEWAGRWAPLERAAREMGFSLSRPWIVPWTRKAHELAALANETGCLAKVHDALFRAYLLDGQDIGRIDVLVELGRKSGMDPLETKAVLDVDRFQEHVETRRGAGVEARVTRVPTLLLHDMRLEGYPKAADLENFLRGETDIDKP